MSMVNSSPIALNLGYDFVLLVHFLGHPVDNLCTDHRLFVIIFQHPENQEIKHSDVLSTSSATLIRG